jgi:hypothetical protein
MSNIFGDGRLRLQPGSQIILGCHSLHSMHQLLVFLQASWKSELAWTLGA